MCGSVDHNLSPAKAVKPIEMFGMWTRDGPCNRALGELDGAEPTREMAFLGSGNTRSCTVLRVFNVLNLIRRVSSDAAFGNRYYSNLF